MPNYVTQMSKEGGNPFLLRDEDARTAVEAEENARETAVNLIGKTVPYMNQLFRTSNNLIIDVSTRQNNKYITPTGQIGDQSYTALYENVPCRPNQQYYRTGHDNSIGGVAFYDGAGQFISYSTNRVFTTPDKTYYFSIWWWTNYGDYYIDIFEGTTSKTVKPGEGYKFYNDEKTNNEISNPLFKEFFTRMGASWSSGYVNASGGISQGTHSEYYSGLFAPEDINGIMFVVPANRRVQLAYEQGGTTFAGRSREYIGESFCVPMTNTYYIYVVIMTHEDNTELTAEQVISAFDLTSTSIKGLSPYVEEANRKANELSLDLVYHVNPDGTGDYENPFDCFQDIWTYRLGKFRTCTVYIHEGVYKIREFYSDYLWNVDEPGWPQYWGLTIPDGVDVIGVGNRENIILTGEDAGTNTIKATLAVKNGCSLQNVTVISENLRYAIHDDMGWDGKPFKRMMRNVHFIDNGSALGTAYGAGTSGWGEYLFENCIFESRTGEHPFSMHNGSGQTVPSSFKFIGCTFITSGNVDAQFPSLDAECDNEVIFIGNKISSIKFFEDDAGAGTHFNLSGGGNSDCTITEEGTGTMKHPSFADQTT